MLTLYTRKIESILRRALSPSERSIAARIMIDGHSYKFAAEILR